MYSAHAMRNCAACCLLIMLVDVNDVPNKARPTAYILRISIAMAACSTENGTEKSGRFNRNSQYVDLPAT